MDRLEAATAKIKELKKGLPAGKQSWRGVCRLLGNEKPLNPYHINRLIRHGKLTPTLDRVLIKHGHLDPPAELIPTEPCWCGAVHPVGWCILEEGEPIKPTPAGKKRKRKRRFSVAAYDPDLALKQLEKYYPGIFLLKDNAT